MSILLCAGHLHGASQTNADLYVVMPKFGRGRSYINRAKYRRSKW